MTAKAENCRVWNHTAGIILRAVTLIMVLLMLPAGRAAPSQAAFQCRFSLGFAQLRDTISEAEGTDIVGACLEDMRYDNNGNAQQHTSNGLLAWAQDTNWTGFTDGTTTWVSGPNGLEKRPNSEQFNWEEEGGAPEGAAFRMFREGTPGSFVTVENLGNETFRYVVDGTEQLFIGMGYNPIYRHLPDAERAANYERDFAVLCRAGVNHITGWDSDKGYEQDKFDEVTLDYARRYGLGVVMPFYLPVDGHYADPGYQSGLMDQAIQKIRRFKDHPALRMWGVGNEVLSEMETPAERVAFLQFYVRLIDLFHDQDPSHPVIYREAEDTFVPLIKSFLDLTPRHRPWFLWGTNVYTTRLGRILDDWPLYRTGSPLIVSEFGAEPDWPGGRSFGYLSMWRTIRSHPKYVLGGAPYVWTVQGPEPVDVKWGLMDDQSSPVDATFDFLTSAWLREGSRSCP